MNSLLSISKWPLFTSSRKGAALILFALALPIALGMIGLVVDGARSFYIKTRFDHALRASVLAGASAIKERRDVLSEARKFFDVNFPANDLKANITQFNVTRAGSTIRITARAECQTYLPNIFLGSSDTKTPDRLSMQGWYEATLTLPNIEVVFVLSNGLRDQNISERTEMLKALQGMVRTISQDNRSQGTYFGVVPFSNGVGVNHNGLCQVLTGRNLSPPRNQTFAPLTQCQYQQRSGVNLWTDTQIIVTDTFYSSWVRATRYRASYSGVDVRYGWFDGVHIAPVGNTTDGSILVDLEHFQFNVVPLIKSYPYQGNFSDTAMLMARNIWPYEKPGTESIDAASSNWVPFYVYGADPRPMASLRSNIEDINARLASILQPTAFDTPEVNNLPNLGMVWASRMISPSWKRRWVDNPHLEETSSLPHDYQDNTYKIIILVTPKATSLSQDIVGTQSPTYPLNLIPETFQKLMNEKFQVELLCRLLDTYYILSGQVDGNRSVNQFIPWSSCGSLNANNCYYKLQTDYFNELNKLKSMFSNNLIDRIVFNYTIRYLWASYIDNPTIPTLPYAGNAANFHNTLWDPKTLISSGWLEVSWPSPDYPNDWKLKNISQPYCFSNVLFGARITENFMENCFNHLYPPFYSPRLDSLYPNLRGFNYFPGYLTNESCVQFNRPLKVEDTYFNILNSFDGIVNLAITPDRYDGYHQSRISTQPDGYLESLNANTIFSYQIIQRSENFYIDTVNNLSDETANLEKILWAKIPAYGILGATLDLNGVSLGHKFNINGTYSTTLSDATTRLNQAFLDACNSLKDPSRKVTIYTINVGGFSDTTTLQACASSADKYFYVDPAYGSNFSNATTSITNIILSDLGKIYLSGKSW